MTDRQIRDRIVGVLSASMMPMEMEAECVAFLDRCLQENQWHTAEDLPPMHTETFEDFDEKIEYQISEPVLIVTVDGKAEVARCGLDDFGKTAWFNDDGTDYEVYSWRYLPEVERRTFPIRRF